MPPPVTPEPAEAAPEGAPTVPELNPLQAALASARERQAAGQPVFKVPAEEPPADPPPEPEPAVAEDPPVVEEPPDGEEEGATAEGAAEDEGTEGEPPVEGEGEPPEPAAAEGAEGEEEAVDEALVVGLPGRREGEDEVEIVAENPEIAERLRQLKNAAVRGDQIKAREEKTERDQKQIEELEVYIGTDPAGFILANVPAAVVDEVAMSLITHPEVWARIQEQVRALEDPAELRIVTAELKAKRAESAGKLRQAVDDRRYAREQGKILKDSIAKMVPVTEGITESRRDTIVQTLEGEAARLIREKNLEKVDPADLVLLLAGTLRAQGIEPMAAAAALAGKAPTDKPAPAKRTSAKRKQPTKAELKAASDKRRKAAVVTPPGASAPAARTKLPPGTRVEEAIKIAREKGIASLRS